MIKPKTCSGCPLYSIGNSFSRPTGNGTNGVIIIGESIDHDAAVEGLANTVKTAGGSKLNEAIQLAGFRWDEFLHWNVIACQPPGGRVSGLWYETQAVEECKQYLRSALETYNPPPGKRKVILATGNLPFQVLTGETHRVDDIAGFPFEVDLWGRLYTVVGTLSPGYVKRGHAELTPVLAMDVQRAVEIAKSGYGTSK